MSVTAHFYTKAIQDCLIGAGINWTSDTLKVALLGSGYTPNLNVDHVWSDISSNEVSGTGYTAGGAALGSTTQSISGGVLTLGGANTVWSSSTITANYAVIYDTSVSNKLLVIVEFGGSVSSTAASFTIAWNASGIVTMTCS